MNPANDQRPETNATKFFFSFFFFFFDYWNLSHIIRASITQCQTFIML